MTLPVLIVDDHPVARGFLGRVARESFKDPLQIVECADLASARRELRLASQSGIGFRLVLLDLELPDGNGKDLLREIRDAQTVKVIASLYADDAHLFPALANGADGYLLKEDRFEVLVDELQKISRGQPPMSAPVARRLLHHFRYPGAAQIDSRPAAVGASWGGLESSRPLPNGPGAPMDHERLTPRENEVLTFLSKGFTIKEIAAFMGIKWFTVNDHIKSIYRKLDVSSRAEAAVFASKQGLV
jgi:two-component system nitrate/nitrite response regulator NarL